MNKTQFLGQEDRAVVQKPSSRWIAELASAAPGEVPGYTTQLIARNARSRALYLSIDAESTPPVYVESSGLGVVFDGTLYNHRELQKELGEVSAFAHRNSAELILTAYRQWGEDLLRRLRGMFALVIWDSSREVCLCLRDPLGAHPLFYAEAGQQLLVSPSIDSLLRHPNVSRYVNRAALMDLFLDRHPRMEETFFSAVSRVPPNQALRVHSAGHNTFRYWDPGPDGSVNWLSEDEVEQFDSLLDQAVSRCLTLGQTGIFLSGGLDSVSVAAVAAELSRAEQLPKPLALSLIFPDPKENEEIIQRGVATELGLPQVLKPFFEATGKDGLIRPALAMSKSLAAPLLNTWAPAYYELALEGARRGCRRILTGNGGDEWLTISPLLAADLLRDFDLAGFYRLSQSMRRSFNKSHAALLLNMLWRNGARPLVYPPVHRAVKKIAPWALKLRHRVMPRPPEWVRPDWLAPDPALRREWDQRREEETANQAQAPSSHYLREVRTSLDHPLVSWELEEMFEVYQRAGVHLVQPYQDADLVDMLYRTPPMLLLHDGRSKGLVRRSLARRFPNLGFERQRKMEATRFYASLIYKDGAQIWEELGGAQTLANLGIIDERYRPVLDRLLQRREDGTSAHRVWTVLNLETWARAQVS